MSKILFHVIKYFLIFINIVFICGTCYIIFKSDQNTQNQYANYLYNNHKYSYKHIHPMALLGSMLMGVYLVGIIGAIKENFKTTLVYAFVMFICLCIEYSVKWPTEEIWLFGYIFFVIFCACTYAAFIRIRIVQLNENISIK